MPKQIKAVIFDHDGTLVETESAHFSVWRELLAELGVDFSEEEYLQDCNGLPSIDNARMFLQRYPIPWSAEQLLAEKETRASAYFADNLPPLMHQVEACVQACRDANLRLAIATGASFDTLEAAIRKRPLYQHFDHIVTADQVKANKPAPDVYRLAIARLGLSADDCIAVEDSPTGIASAKAAGLFCIAVPSAYSQHQDLGQADCKVESLTAASEHILRFC